MLYEYWVPTSVPASFHSVRLIFPEEYPTNTTNQRPISAQRKGYVLSGRTESEIMTCSKRWQMANRFKVHRKSSAHEEVHFPPTEGSQMLCRSKMMWYTRPLLRSTVTTHSPTICPFVVWTDTPTYHGMAMRNTERAGLLQSLHTDVHFANIASLLNVFSVYEIISIFRSVTLIPPTSKSAMTTYLKCCLRLWK